MDPLTSLLDLISSRAPRFVGLSGPPGSGKTTLARAVQAHRPDDTVVISLDDFYIGKDERARRGLPWRGPPGSHDLPALLEVLTALHHGLLPVDVPRFDPAIDDRTDGELVLNPPGLVIVEGWYLGYPHDGYGAILEHLDLLAYLEVDTVTARTRRFAREDALRAQGGGFTPDEMQRFWDDVLEPGIVLWTQKAKASADVILDPTQ